MHESKPLSKDSMYYIDQHRYLELKNFCLQYNRWKRMVDDINYYSQATGIIEVTKSKEHSNRTEYLALIRKKYEENIEMVNRCCKKVDDKDYILKAVTQQLTYDKIRARYENIPFSEREFYKRKRQFFLLLDQERN